MSVAWITYAPVKGLRLSAADEVELTQAGVPGDRRFHLVNERGHLTNGKRVGALQQVQADWDERSQWLTLVFPDGGQVAGEVTTDGELTTSFYGRPVKGRLVTGPFAAALSEFTGTPLRLVQPVAGGAGIDRGRRGAVTLLSVSALAPLAEAAGVEEVDPRRFRMLFGIDGVEAHAEDAWIGRRVQIGDAIVRPRGHVGRCQVTTRDPLSGTSDLDTLGALADYRRDVDSTEALPFGVYGEVVSPGRVRRGDPVVLIDT